MILFKKAKEIQQHIDNQRKKDYSIGFVPTMGALHPGHISLIEKSKKEGNYTVASIFINPTQFNDPKDFEKYPVTIEQDIYLLEKNGCDAVFLPTVHEMYPPGEAQKKYDLGAIETILEGQYRPGHFQGVCTIVEKLLNIVIPDNLYLGQKDYQQCMVIAKLLDITNLSEKIKLNVCPTLREKNGLAMSSRNTRLSSDEKEKAGTIYQTLCYIKDNILPGMVAPLIETARKKLVEKNLKVDYVTIADAHTLHSVNNWDGKQKIVTLAAVYNNEVRLIDNMLLN